MSTDFYWKPDSDPRDVITFPTGFQMTVDIEWDHPEIWIGKQTNGKMVLNQKRQNVLDQCNSNPYDHIAIDEYGTQYSGKQLKAILDAT